MLRLLLWLVNVPSQSEIEARLTRLKQGKLVVAAITLSFCFASQRVFTSSLDSSFHYYYKFDWR